MSGLESFFNPRSIALIGASRSPEKVGYVVLKNLLECGYAGRIYPVNPQAREILGLKCFERVSLVPDPVDVAVLTIPAAGALQAADECGAAGVKHLVTVTAGFRELGREGYEREKSLVEICRRYGMRMLGPNCLGMIDVHSRTNLSFAARFPAEGNIAFISQSGALGVAILDWCLERDIGLSKFVSLGNKADLNESDFIESLARDEDTRVILCYLEDVTDGGRFVSVVTEAVRRKPVIVFKSGTTEAGARAASSHTGALAGSDRSYDTAFRQYGLIRAHSIEELFQHGIALAMQPVPNGNRIAVITNAGGPGIVASDLLEKEGLSVARFQKETIDRLRSGLPEECSVYNPVDLIATADADRYRFAVGTIMRDPGVDGTLIILTPTAVTDPSATAEAIIAEKAALLGKPAAAVFMGGPLVREGSKRLLESGIPCYSFPEEAVGALRALYRYKRIREGMGRDRSRPKVTGVDVEAISRLLSSVKEEGRAAFMGHEGKELAGLCGIPVAPSRLATNTAHMVDFAKEVGFPIVLKVASPKILHKSDVGGVKVGLKSPEEARRAYMEILDSVHRYMPGVPVYGIEVQKMMPAGVELIVGATRDVQFGPMVAFGLGGIYVNLIKDASFRLARGLSPEEIEEMISETRASVLLRGFRSGKPLDRAGVVDVIARVAEVMERFPEIVEFEINPLLAYERQVVAIDVKVTIG